MGLREIELDIPTTRTYKTKANLVNALSKLVPDNVDIQYIAVQLGDRWTAILITKNFHFAIAAASKGFRVEVK